MKRTELESIALQAERAAQVTDFSRSEDLLLQAYDFARVLYGSDSGEVGVILLRLAAVCQKQGKTELANEYLAETDRIASLYEET